MALWLIMMFGGLLALAMVFYKVWNSPSGGVDRRWFVLALAGTLASIVGLVMTMRGLSSETETPFVPQATIERGAPDIAPPPLSPNTSPMPADAGNNAPPQKPDPISAPSLDAIPHYDPKKYPEEQDGETFNHDDLKYFVNQTKTALNELEKQVSLNLEPTPDGQMPTNTRWKMYALEHDARVRKLRSMSTMKKGPDSGRVRQIVFAIASNLDKMERVYHNSVIFGGEPDLQYIAQLQDTTERLLKELEETIPQ